MLAVINVHIAGGDPWWHTLVGPALIAATAIAAAVIAAKTANRRQGKQLEHDRDLQSEQLAYDREQRARQHVRDAVDEAIKGTDDAIRVMAEYVTLMVTGNEKREANRTIAAAPAAEDQPLLPVAASQDLSREIDQIRDLSNGISDASMEMTSQSLRLSLRLGVDHPIVQTHTRFRIAFENRHDALHPFFNKAISEKDRIALDGAAESSSDAHVKFIEACRSWLMEE